ncbi:hypothetical protein JW865_08020 [Candidatus Bathyarchaeota archaeon]|nr:hypothetical protein [Candidatus Bathyarchaeota archaeon]
MTQQKIESELKSVINLCKAVTSGSIEPFDIDVDYILSVIRKHYPELKNVQELCTDASALKELSNVLERQKDWIQYKTTTLYKDPFLLNQQILKMEISNIAKVFLKSWRPLVEMEQISAKTLAGSLGYWADLIPLNDRWKEPDLMLIDAEIATIEDAKMLGFLPEEGFVQSLEAFWVELGQKANETGIIDYWDWIGADTYEETVKRSYLTVFLVSYGYANIKIDQLTDSIEISYNKEQNSNPKQSKISIPTMVDYEEWKKWRKE